MTDYSFKEKILIRLADLVFYGFIKVLGSLTRFEVRGLEHFDSIEGAGKLPIYTMWHDRIFLGTYFWRDRGIVVITSKSFDGEYIARFLLRFGYGAIRGSSSRGGATALVGMIKSMRDGHPMAFTVDGPRGPRYVAKAGPVLLAKKTGNPIMPLIAAPKKFWNLKSWDKMQIPKPFSPALILIGEPIYVDANATADEVDEKVAQLQKNLDDLVAEGKVWSGRSDV